MTQLSRRDFMKTTGAGISMALASSAFTQPSSKPTNILMLMSDEHNPRYSSVGGHPFIHTPNMERLAQRGVVYEHAYCPSPLCMPSRSAFMAGKYVHQLQTYSNCNAIENTYPSYGERLRQQGLHTAYIGKCDVYRPCKDLGFSEVIHPGDRSRPGDPFIQRHPLCIRDDAAARANAYGPKEADPFASNDTMIAAAMDWLRRKPAELQQPWSLTVNIGKPHFPHLVTQELWDQYPQGADLPHYGKEPDSARHPYAEDLRAHFQTDLFTEEQIRGLRRGYLGCVTYVDRQLGKLLDTLDALGLAENTLVAYTSDHGEMLGKFGMWWKCSLYEDSVRVPLIVAGPGFAAGKRVKTPVSTLDLQAAFFEAAHAKRPEDWRGTPLQTITENDPDKVTFAEYHGHGTRSGAFMIRKGPWKLLYNMEAPHQLFNLAKDPEELINCADHDPDKFNELVSELRRICNPEEENSRAHAMETRLLEMTKGKK